MRQPGRRPAVPGCWPQGPHPLSSSSGGPPWSVPVITDGHGDKRSGIRAAPTKKTFSQDLCVYSSVPSFCRKTTPSKPIVLDSTCGLPKRLVMNAPVPVSNGHYWNRVVRGKVDLDGFLLTTSSPCCAFSTPLQVLNATVSTMVLVLKLRDNDGDGSLQQDFTSAT